MFQRGVETFLAVVRLKTLKAASEELHLAQSTVSKRLQQLEEECGIALFDRGKGGKEASLTPAGERFVGVAERMLDLLHEARRFTSEQGHHALSVGAVTSMHSVFIPRLFTRLLDSTPAMRLTAATLHSSEMYEEIDRRSIDVGFSLLDKAHPNVIVSRCFSEPMLVMRRDAGAKPDAATVLLEDLDFGQEICFPWTPHYEVRRLYHSPTISPRVFVDDPTLLTSLLCRPEQWAFVPLTVARHFCKTGAFQVARPHPKPPDRVCYQLTHKYPRVRAAESLALLQPHLDQVLDKEFGKKRDGGASDMA